VRVVSGALAVCVLLALAAVFMPSLEARIDGVTFGRRGTMSLYKASTERALARRLFASYARSKGRRYGEALATALLPRVKSRLHAVVDDIGSAMSTLDEVTDDDVRTGGTVLVIAIWAFLGLELLLGGVVLGESLRDDPRRGRLIAAIAIALIAAAIAIALHLVCREAAWEANDELGTEVVALGIGAYVLPVASLGGLVAAIVLLVQRLRRR